MPENNISNEQKSENIEEDQLFLNGDFNNENTYFYFGMISVSKKMDDGTYQFLNNSENTVYDNTSCPKAPLSYSVMATEKSKDQSSNTLLKSIEEKDEVLPGVSCGSISGDKGDRGPPVSHLFPILIFIIGFGLSISSCSFLMGQLSDSVH